MRDSSRNVIRFRPPGEDTRKLQKVPEQLMSDGVTPLGVIFEAMKYNHHEFSRHQLKAIELANIVERAKAQLEALLDQPDHAKIKSQIDSAKRRLEEYTQREIVHKADAEKYLTIASKFAVEAAPYCHAKYAQIPVAPVQDDVEAVATPVTLSHLSSNEREFLRTLALTAASGAVASPADPEGETIEVTAVTIEEK